MTTRFGFTVLVGEWVQDVEAVRDGFNVYVPEIPHIVISHTSVLGTDLWAYADGFEGFPHRAVFFNEVDVTAHMMYRVRTFWKGRL